jgi:hypothetical protein
MVAKKREASVFEKLLAAVVLIAVSPLILLVIGLYLVAGILLHIAVWCVWCTRGRDVLLVYSNSPIWQEYVEQHLLPPLGGRAIILNWSDRSEWSRTLAVTVFRFFGGSREYNPMAIVFRPFRLARCFRFYKAFRDFKHGKPEAVDKLTGQLFALLDGNKVHLA